MNNDKIIRAHLMEDLRVYLQSQMPNSEIVTGDDGLSFYVRDDSQRNQRDTNNKRRIWINTRVNVTYEALEQEHAFADVLAACRICFERSRLKEKE
jgi:hypothetical protein